MVCFNFLVLSTFEHEHVNPEPTIVDSAEGTTTHKPAEPTKVTPTIEPV